MVSPVSITNVFNGDISAANLVNAAALDTQLTNLAATVNAEITERQRTVRDGSGLASQVVRFPALHPEITSLLVAGGARPLQAVAAVSITNVAALAGLLVVDGYTLLAADRVLLTGQTNPVQNGIWLAAAGAWTRPLDSVTGVTLPLYSETGVANGTTQSGSIWLLNPAAVVDSVSQKWALFSGNATVTPISRGGTSATTAAAARAALGLSTLATLANVSQSNLNTDVQYRVDTVSALKALTTNYATVLVTGYYAAGDGGGGIFRWDNPSALVNNGGTIITSDSAPANGRWLRVMDQASGINVHWFGAKGDGVTDDTAAIQATATLATTQSGSVQFLRGVYLITAPIIIDLSAVTLDPINGSRTRVAFWGEGSGSSTIKSTHIGKAIDYRGGTGEGVASFFSWRGLSLVGPNRAVGSTGISISKMSYFTFDDFDIALYEYGIDATDILSGSFNNATIRLNKYGFRLAYSSFSRPNAIAFRDVRLAGNYTYGGLVTGGSCIIYDGGTVEGNGIGETLASVNAWGLKVVDCGVEGAVGLVTKGTYFEGTNGYADVWVYQSSTPVSHDIHGTFVRYINTQYSTYSVAFDRIGGGAGSRCRIGGGFKSLGTYVESAARPYLGGGIAFFDVADGTYFSSAVAVDNSSWTPTGLPAYPISFLPSAVTYVGGQAICTDLGGGSDHVISDGVNWKRINENSQATVSTDVNFTVTALTDAVHQIHSGTLTADRAVTLSTTRAYRGGRFKFTRNGPGAFNLSIGGLKNLIPNTWCEVTYNGSSWALTAYGVL